MSRPTSTCDKALSRTIKKVSNLSQNNDWVNAKGEKAYEWDQNATTYKKIRKR